MLKGCYPEASLERISHFIVDGDLEIIHFPVDMVGVNYYLRFFAYKDETAPFGVNKKTAPATGSPKLNSMGWEIYGQGFYDQLIELKNDYGNPLIYITENGCACNDIPNEKGFVEDTDQIAFLKEYLEAMIRARNDGANVQGYFIWSLLDNFEWEMGLGQRLGVVRVDYKTLKRIPKASYYWMKEIIRTGKMDL